MKKSVREKWNKLVKDGAMYQEMAAFFWNSDKSSDEDKYWLNNHLESFEDMINQKDEYNESQAQMAIIHMQLRIDGVQMYVRSHPELKQDYDYSTDKQSGYREWLRFYILSDASRELHIIGDRKAPKKLFQLKAQKEKVRT